MRLRFGRVLEQSSVSYHSLELLPTFESSLLYPIMSQHPDNLSVHDSDHGDHDPLEPNMFQPLRDYLHPLRQTAPSCIILPVNHHMFNVKPTPFKCYPLSMVWT